MTNFLVGSNLQAPNIEEKKHFDENDGAHRQSTVEHLVLEDVGEGGGVPGEQVRVPRRGELA